MANSKLSMSSVPDSLKFNPIIRNKIIEITKEGIVVYIIYFICVNKSVPAMAEAKLVVSDNGDILSPKYAPDIIAPPISPVGIPRTFPIPSKAIPIVAIVLHELPCC